MQFNQGAAMTTNASQTSAPLLWTGRILSGLVIAFLLFDAGIKLVPIQPVIDTMQSLGFVSTPALARILGVLLLACTLLHAMPKTSLLGAVLLTGYLGGAMAIQLRADNPLFSHLLFGGYLGAMLWTGLLLREKKIRDAFLA
jgi:hypothetical protein